MNDIVIYGEHGFGLYQSSNRPDLNYAGNEVRVSHGRARDEAILVDVAGRALHDVVLGML